MSKRNTARIWFSVIGTFILFAAILGGGYMAYRTGYTQGAIAEQAGEVESFSPPVPFHGYRYYYPHFGFGSIFFTFLFFMLIFGMVRRLFFPRWGWYGKHYHPKAWKRHHMGPWFEDDDEGKGGESEKDTETS